MGIKELQKTVINFILLIILVITQVLGDIWLSQGMKIYGEVTSYSPQAILSLFSYLFTSFWIWLGVATLALSWFLYLISVSRMDLNYVLSIGSSNHIFNAFMAWLMLHEFVSPLRWLATIIIAVGVLIVGLSKYQSDKYYKIQVENINKNKPKIKNFLLSLPFSFYLSKIWLGILLLVIADSCGDLLTAKGMKNIGSISSFSLLAIINWLTKIATNLSLLCGVLSQAIALLIFLSLLSWGDISLIRPASSLAYILSLLSAKYILNEKINKTRLLGIIIISCGIVIISLT